MTNQKNTEVKVSANGGDHDYPMYEGIYVYPFREQWDKRHAKKPERQWAENPWVWRIEFKVKQRSGWDD